MPQPFPLHKYFIETEKHTHTHAIIGKQEVFSTLSPLLAALTCGLVVQLSVTVIEITVCYHFVSMRQKNISLLGKQAHTRWCHLSVDKQLALKGGGTKLQSPPHKENKQHLCVQPCGAQTQRRIIENRDIQQGSVKLPFSECVCGKG